MHRASASVLIALLACGVVAGCGDSSSQASSDDGAFERGFEERQRDYLEFAAAEQGRGGVNTQLARLAMGLPIVEEPIREAIAKVQVQKDTADFSMVQLLRLFFLYDSSLSVDLREEIEEALLGFRYWFDEPGTRKVSLSENHQILFAAGEYLVGQRYPEVRFSNSGLTGVEHMAKARVRILRWFGDRARFGYSEWLSATYYGIDVPGILALIDFAEDREIRDAATVAMDLLAYDLALNSYQGHLGSTHGRVPGSNVLFDLGAATVATTHRILFDQGEFRGTNEWAGTALATSSYVPPRVLAAVAQDRSSFVNRQRNGITVEQGPGYGYGYDGAVAGAFWYGMGAWTDPLVLPLTVSMIEDFGQVPVAVEPEILDALADVLGGLPDAVLEFAGRALSPLTSGSLYDRVDIYTYRTPDVMLSSAQDDMKGTMGFQQHAWQATLGPRAVVFTTHPGPLDEDSSLGIGSTAWLGGSSMPRVGQRENVAVVIYDAQVTTLLGGALASSFPDFTHAYFPRAEFDEVLSVGSWTLARRGEGYVALYSATPTTWTTAGEFADRELVAPGSRNVWICEIGSAAVNGSFEDFTAAITSAVVQVDGTDVVYASPTRGRIEFGWNGPMDVDGAEVVVGGHPRYQNPFSDTPWDATELVVEHGSHRLRLDLEALRRVHR